MPEVYINFIQTIQSLKPHFVRQYPSVFEWMAPILLLFVIAEIFYYRKSTAKSFPKRELISSIFIGAGYGAAKLLATIAHAGAYLLLWEYRIWEVPLNSVASWVAVFLFVEFAYYWYHRVSHRCKWYWASHAVHHTPENLYFAVAFQLPWTGIITPMVPFFAPLVLLGFHPGALIFALNTNLIFQFFLHTETIKKFPSPIEYIFNTPSHHRVHHARNANYLDKNYGGLLIIFDRMFGTFCPEQKSIPCEYGLVKPHRSLNPLIITFRPTFDFFKEWFMIPGLKNKFIFPFLPPEAELAMMELQPLNVVRSPTCNSQKQVVNNDGQPY